MDALPLLARDLGNEELRTRLSRASLFAGLAFSNTRTALAHALSYHLTLHHGVPHGIACSFSLPMVMRGVAGCDPACDAAPAPHLRRRPRGRRRAPRSFPARRSASRRTPPTTASPRATGRALVDDALAGERGRNFIGRRESARWPQWPPEQIKGRKQ